MDTVKPLKFKSKLFALCLLVVFFVGFILGIAFVAMVFRSFEAQDDVILQSAVNSPEKKYTAVLYTNMGGGAAGYCYSYLSVVPFVKFDLFQKAKYTVASGKCTHRGHTVWTSDTALEVVDFVTDTQEEYNEDKRVKISY